jgi:hypothetical protein
MDPVGQVGPSKLGHLIIQIFATLVPIPVRGKDRLLLCEDAEAEQSRLLAAGLAAGVPPPKGNLPPQSIPPQCHKPGR